MDKQIASFGRVMILLGTALLLLAGFAAAWAVWHVVAGRALGPTLLFYADGASNRWPPLTERPTKCATNARSATTRPS